MPRLILYFALCIIMVACNIRDLDRLEDVAEDHARRLARLEKMLIEARDQINTIHKLLTDYDGRLTITGSGIKDDGSSWLAFSDGDTIRLNTAETPQIELSGNGTWVINGENTGIKHNGVDASGDVDAPQIQKKDGFWQISADGGDTWTNTGVKVQGENGVVPGIPRISVGSNGNWYIDDTDTGYPLKGEDGASVSAPEISVGENGNWWIKNNGGIAQDTGIPTEGEDGEDGGDAQGTPYIKEVVVSGSKVSFIFSGTVPGVFPTTNVITVTRKVDFSYTVLEDGEWVTLPRKPFAIPIGTERAVTLKVVLPAGRSWRMRSIDMPAGFDFLGEEKSGYSETITCKIRFSLQPGVNEYRSGLVFYTIYDQYGTEYMSIIPVATQLYRINMEHFDFADSYVYHVYNDAREKVAEVCREYINDGTPGGKQATVIYPYNERTHLYGTGYVTGLGGFVDHTTARYNPLGNYPAGKNDVYFLSPELFFSEPESFMAVTPLEKANFVPDKVIDVKGTAYKIVKVGTQYWMAENLKTTFYANGDPVRRLTDPAAWTANSAGYCDYAPVSGNNGLIYKMTAASSGMLAPAGWHIPDFEEWRLMELYIGMSEAQVDITGWRGTLEGNKLKANGHWPGESGSLNITLFGAFPLGICDENGLFGGADNACAWWITNSNPAGLWQWRLEQGKGGINFSEIIGGKGGCVRCIRDFK